MSTAIQGFSDSDYLACDWFSSARGDDSARMVSTRIVTTKKEQHCAGNGQGESHTIPLGSRALCESALIDGSWGRYYLCTGRMDGWLNELNGMDDESICVEHGGGE